MKLKNTLFLFLFFTIGTYVSFSQVNIDVNLNIEHSVDGVSDFGRDRHIQLHANINEHEWTGEEEKMDYLINELDVYMGRDNGAANNEWKYAKADPDRTGFIDRDAMVSRGQNVKSAYSNEYWTHQFESKGENMIQGLIPQSSYPSFGFGANDSYRTSEGWQSTSIECSAEWVAHYLKNNFSLTEGAPGKPLPKYWEVMNEFDMHYLTGGGDLWTSLQTAWDYHDAVADSIESILGDQAPLVGGFTWGLHDLYMGDGVPGRFAASTIMDDSWTHPRKDYISPELAFEPYRSDDFYQWDVMWQGFIDQLGDKMDFHAVHIYDWPKYETPNSKIRAGGHTEAILDMLEWYDYHRDGERKPVVISEYGAVNFDWNKTTNMNMKRRDWENLKPFNSMLMQFLERPSQVVMSVPFTPIKGAWGDIKNAAGDVIERYAYSMMESENMEGEVWYWSEFIKFYELWSDVKGTRIETKAANPDIQVDAYVDGNHVYLILNNLIDSETTLNLNFFGENGNTVESVHMKHLYLNMALGAEGEPFLDDRTMKTAPGSVTLGGDATMILDYTYASNVVPSSLLDEKKYMGARLGSGTHALTGGDIIHRTLQDVALSTTVEIPSIPTNYEAVLRISGVHYIVHLTNNSPVITVNGTTIAHDNNWRGELYDEQHSKWFGTLEIEIPQGVLQAGTNTVTCQAANVVGYTTVQIQMFDFETVPGRSDNGDPYVSVTSVSTPSTMDLMIGESEGITATIEPSGASDKTITWSSSAPGVATVDEFGVVTAISVGSADIVATSVDGPSSTTAVDVSDFVSTPVSGVTISEGASLDVELYVLTKLNAVIAPEDATEKTVTWSSADESIAEVNPTTGKVLGKSVGESTTITATVIDTYNGNAVHTVNITVNVGIVGEEAVYSSLFPESVPANTSYTFDVAVNISGERTVVLEMYNGVTKIGEGSTLVDGVGNISVPVDITLGSAPSIGTNYSLTAILMDGASTIDNASAPLEIVSAILPTEVTIKDWLRIVQVGHELPVEATIAPEDAFNKTINWTSSDDGIATVNESGIITGVTAGTVTITATADGNSSVTAQVQITVQTDPVEVEPTSITIPSNVTIIPGNTFQLPVVFEPEWTTEKDVNWESSNNSAATVNDGLVTAGASGTSTITATSASSPSVSATCDVTASSTIVIEAETYEETGGTFDDSFVVGGPGYGFSHADGGLTWGNTGDWVDYTLTIATEGKYQITYYISSPEDGAEISSYADGTLISTDAVTNNGSWDTYIPLVAADSAYLEPGVHTFRLLASSAAEWQWSADRIELVRVASLYNGPAVDGVTVDPTSATILVGGTQQLTETISPVDAGNKSVTWSSSNNSIATVSSTGLVTGAGVGSATITVTTVDGGFTANSAITVDPVLVTGVTVDPTTITVFDESPAQTITATIEPDNATDQSVSWSSSNEAVATVVNGIVTIEGIGTAMITVTTNDGDHTANTAVTVQAIPVTEVELNHTEATIAVGATVDFVATITPDNATNQNVSWSSDDIGVATVVDGTVTGESDGTATITVTTADGGFTANAIVTVDANFEPVTGVSIESSTTTILVGDTVHLHEIIEPSDADNKNVSWTVQYDTVASLEVINDVAVITGEWVGETDITVETQDGGFTDVVTITVNPVQVTGLTLNTSSEVIHLGDNLTLTATIEPDNATYPQVSWSSDNPAVATVNNNGFVESQGFGIATIRATADSNNSIYAEATIEVDSINVTGISVTPTTTTVIEESTVTLAATIEPGNATDPTVRWVSSDETKATVAGGVVTGVSAGDVTIYVISNDGGYTASSAVTVIEKVDPELTADNRNKYLTTNYVVGGSISMTAYFEAGTGNTVTDEYDGIEYFFRLMPNENDWSEPPVFTINVYDTDAIGETSGTSTVTIPLPDTLKPSSELDEGHFYFIYSRFESSGGELIEMQGLNPIILVSSAISVTGVTVSPDEGALEVGETLTLSANVTPIDASNKNVIWSSSDEDIATVDINGVVTTKALGNVDITATTEDGGFTAVATIHVVDDVVSVEGVAFASTSETIKVDSSVTLVAEITPNYATNKKVTWVSNNPSIASVDANGVVTGHAVGTATITVTTKDGNKTATITIKVEKASNINESVLSNVTLYPNPATDIITLAGLTEGSYKFNVVGITGAEYINVETFIRGKESIDISQLPVGLYILNIKSEDIMKSYVFNKVK